MGKKNLEEAFKKLERKELLLLVLREQFALGRITWEEFSKREAEIVTRFALTNGEERAYSDYLRMNRKSSN